MPKFTIEEHEKRMRELLNAKPKGQFYKEARQPLMDKLRGISRKPKLPRIR